MPTTNRWLAQSSLASLLLSLFLLSGCYMAHDQEGRPIASPGGDGSFILIVDDLPEGDPAGLQYVFLQARPAVGHPLELPWMGGDVGGQRLPPRPSTQCLRVNGPAGTDVNAKARVCRSEHCLDLADANAPEVWFEIEAPIYEDRETVVRVDFAGSPLFEPLPVDRCEVEGCIEGETTTFCSDATGLHFCETNTTIERAEDCPRPIPSVEIF